MEKGKADKIVNVVTKKLIESGMNVYKIILFGSYYNGEPDRDSDVDIAIISDDFKDKDVFERAKLTYKAEWSAVNKFKLPMDVVKLTVDEYENETRMIASYVKEGKVVYSAK